MGTGTGDLSTYGHVVPRWVPQYLSGLPSFFIDRVSFRAIKMGVADPALSTYVLPVISVPTVRGTSTGDLSTYMGTGTGDLSTYAAGRSVPNAGVSSIHDPGGQELPGMPRLLTSGVRALLGGPTRLAALPLDELINHRA